MTRVTHGVVRSSFQATLPFFELAKVREKPRETSRTPQSDFNFEDILPRARCDQDAKHLQASLNNTFKEGKFCRRQCTCSEPHVI